MVGAGVSGSVSALKLAKAGFNVVLAEREKKIGAHSNTKVDITENKDIEHIIKELKLRFAGRSNKSKWFSPHNDFLFESRVHDLFVKRGPDSDSFDVVIAKAAVKAGAELFLSSQVKDFNFVHSDFVKSVVLKKNGKKLLVFPKFVVCADGSESSCLKLSGLNKTQGKGVEIVGFGIIAENLGLPVKQTHIFFDSELIPGGYFFVGKAHRGLGVASIVLNKAKINGSLKKYFDAFVKSNDVVSKMLSNVNVLNFFKGSCKTVALKQHFRGNVALVGDAARVMDPVFGYGVRPAILSGYLAAQALEKSLSKNRNFLFEYERNLNQDLLFDENFNHFLRRVFDRLDNSDLDFIVESAHNTHKFRNLDIVLEKPGEHKRVFLKASLRKPVKTLKIARKVLLERLFPYY